MSRSHEEEEHKKEETVASFKEYLTQKNSPSDHLPRKTGKNKVIWNIMTQAGPNSIDLGTGGFLTEDETTKTVTNEMKEEYENRLFGDKKPSVKLSIVESVKKDPDLEFFLLQEAPKVIKVSGDEKEPEENIGQEFIDETLKKLNEGCEAGKEQWACTTQYNEGLSKCIFYRCDRYKINEEYTEKLSNAVKSSARQKLSDKECFAVAFENKENSGIHALYNIHLDPGRGREFGGEGPDKTEAEITTLFSQAEESVPKDLLKTTFVGGDCNFNVGIGGQGVTPADTSVNTYDLKNADRVGVQTSNSVDAGFERSQDPDQPFVRSIEQVINPDTGMVSSCVVPENSADQIKENSYGEMLFGHLSRPELKIDIGALRARLKEFLPAPEGEEQPTQIRVKIEANSSNAHRIAITSTKPILYYEDLMAQGTQGITVETNSDGLKYCLQLDGENAVPKEAYDPALMHAQLSKLTSQRVMADYSVKYREDISKKREELKRLTQQRDKNKEVLDEKRGEYRERAEDKAIADYLEKINQKDNEEKKKELKDGLALFLDDNQLAEEHKSKKNAVIRHLKKDPGYIEVFSASEGISQKIREIDKLEPEEREKLLEQRDILDTERRGHEKTLADRIEKALQQDDEFQKLNVLKNLRDNTYANLKNDRDVMPAQRDYSVSAFDVDALTKQLKYAVEFTDTLTPEALGKINLILDELYAYRDNLKDSRLFDKDILDKKKEAIGKLIGYLEQEDTYTPTSEKLAGFSGVLKEHKKTLESRNDKAWAKAGKVLLSLVLVWTVVVPYSLWKTEGKDKVKKMENIAGKENDAPRQKAR